MRVGVVGVGVLGRAVAARLASTSAQVRVHDVDPVALERARASGLEAAADLPSLAGWADVVCVVVGSAGQVRDVLLGDSGLCAVAGLDLPVLVHSTIGPSAARALGDDCRPRGLHLVDAPVSGGPGAAADGDLALMVGGEGHVLERVMPVLAALGTPHVVGGVGAGQATKLANQVVTFATQAALLEALRLAESLGVDEADVRLVLGEGLADSWCLRHWGFFDDTAKDYDRSGLPPGDRPWAKDLRHALEEAASAGVDLPVTAVVARHAGPAIDAHARRAAPAREEGD